MIKLTPETDPTEPVTPTEAKMAARVGDVASFDALVPGLITSAREMAEQIAGRPFVPATWRTELDDWPAAGITINLAGATAVAVTYWDGAAWATLAGSGYAWAPVGNTVVLALALGATWPTLPEVAIGPRVRIDVTAGPADATAVPESVKLYIKAMVAHWINQPAATSADRLAPVPYVDRLLDAVRIYHA